jgi:hypothetical protein
MNVIRIQVHRQVGNRFRPRFRSAVSLTIERNRFSVSTFAVLELNICPVWMEQHWYWGACFALVLMP